MMGVFNRLPHAVCEVGTCFVAAAFTEEITVVPGDPALKDERHWIEVLCRRHETEFQEGGLVGTITAYGDQIVGSVNKERQTADRMQCGTSVHGSIG